MILLSFNTRSQNKRLLKTLGYHPVIKGVCKCCPQWPGVCINRVDPPPDEQNLLCARFCIVQSVLLSIGICVILQIPCFPLGSNLPWWKRIKKSTTRFGVHLGWDSCVKGCLVHKLKKLYCSPKGRGQCTIYSVHVWEWSECRVIKGTVVN